MENYIHVKIFILWTLIISTLANEWTKILSPSPNPTQMHNLSLWAEPTNKHFFIIFNSTLTCLCVHIILTCTQSNYTWPNHALVSPCLNLQFWIISLSKVIPFNPKVWRTWLITDFLTSSGLLCPKPPGFISQPNYKLKLGLLHEWHLHSLVTLCPLRHSYVLKW